MMSGELNKMQEYREAHQETSFSELMLLYEVVIELLCQKLDDELANSPNRDYVLYGMLKSSLNSVMYKTLHPNGSQAMSLEEFKKSIQGADGSHIRG